MAETTHHRRPATASRAALVAVAATFLLGACAQTGPGDAPGAGAAPTGSSSASAPASPDGDGDGSDDGTADGGPSVAWLDEGRSFSLTLYGSSTCPPAVESVEAAGADAVTVRLAPADQGMCTMDYVPTVSEHDLPDGVDGRPVAIDVVVAAGEGAEPVSLELP
ncbi:hypothetical protein [Frigoribacterium sp. PvP032]|uniref:hypothetical protein n=1 Tax=Frigoribacterium sp. PvP032 TaxID=2806589 RepID=UPI001AE4E881|nr:hypothetical protein [Frigoribacterium sp. PvP032]MBP1189242.1 hypothetical protein [Frigoribacterium sp. PvP032]